MGKWTGRALDWVFPRACLECGEDLRPPLAGPLCGACLLSLRPLSGRLCRRCGVPSGGRDPCADCRGLRTIVEPVRAAFAYGPPVRRLLHAFKFRGQSGAGRALAGWMAGLWPRWPELAGADALVPVPVHPARLRARGFNQARVLAEAVAKTARLPVWDALERGRRTRPQWGLGRAARARNLSRALSTPPDGRIEGRRLVLVDDLVTTGATLDACARALAGAGASRVSAYVLAKEF